MNERRHLKRFSLKLKARYRFDDMKGTWKECSVVDMTSKGMGLKFHTRETLTEGAPIFLAIVIDDHPRPVQLKGVVQWGGEGADGCACGVQLTEILDEITWNNLVQYMS